MEAKKIIADANYLKIVWDDGTQDELLLTNVRWNCPCAHCSKARAEEDGHHFTIFQKEQLTIKKIKPVGNYAVQIVWEDGHDSGIYTYELLKKLAEDG